MTGQFRAPTAPRSPGPEVVVELRGKPVPYCERAGVRAGRVWSYRPDHVKRYQAQLKYAAQQVMGDRPPLDGSLEVVITAAIPVPGSWSKVKTALALGGDLRPTTRPDWDNYAKAAVDACNQVVWRDDAVICDAHVRKVFSTTPSMRIEVRRPQHDEMRSTH